MKLDELKTKKIIVGDPVGQANSMAELAERMFDSIGRLEFLKDDFETPLHWAKGVARDEKFFEKFYKKREAKHLSTGFYTEVEKNKIKAKYAFRAEKAQNNGKNAHHYLKAFAGICKDWELILDRSGGRESVRISFDRGKLRSEYERPLTDAENQWLDLLEEIRKKIVELKDFENTHGMAGTFRLDRLPYYFTPDGEEFNSNIFIFNYQNNNQ